MNSPTSIKLYHITDVNTFWLARLKTITYFVFVLDYRRIKVFDCYPETSYYPGSCDSTPQCDIMERSCLTAETISTLVFLGDFGDCCGLFVMTGYLWRLTLMSCDLFGCEILFYFFPVTFLFLFFCVMAALYLSVHPLTLKGCCSGCGKHLHGNGQLFTTHLWK